ncbi:MAG: alpha/beta hydrolase [Rhodoferax sp.]|nr:alpha/beta hydrolase [Rhodoferax sp.]
MGAMETFTADDGERLHLRIVGNGTPVLLLHGWTSSHAVWNPLLPTLTAGYQVFCPDARCHGGHGTLATTQPSIERLARDVLNLIVHYGLNNLAVVGHSMGALTLWQFIRDYGCKRLSHLCIIDQSPKLVTDAEWHWHLWGFRCDPFATLDRRNASRFCRGSDAASGPWPECPGTQWLRMQQCSLAKITPLFA